MLSKNEIDVQGLNNYFLLRSLLNIPLNKEKVFTSKYYAKWSGSFDSIILDLEDSVPEDFKEIAIKNLPKILSFYLNYNHNVMVRVGNQPKRLAAEIDVLNKSQRPLAVVIPKVQSRECIDNYSKKLSEEFEFGVVIESPLAYLNLNAILTHPQVKFVLFGPLDFSACMGLKATQFNMLPIASHISVICSALGLPLFGVVEDFSDIYSPEWNQKFTNSLVAAKSLGFNGTYAIHPKQLSAIEKVFGLTDKEKEMMKAMISQISSTRGLFVLNDEMIGPPVRKRYETILKRSEGI
jgi:citrate lyase subunit beta/citryl-CoA lyase